VALTYHKLYILTAMAEPDTCNTYFSARFTYEIQDEAGGIARMLRLAEDFTDDEAVIPCDNIFQDNVKDAVQSFKTGAHIFLKAVPYAARFGVATVFSRS
jgi:glucose-1-phosphate thymidylyltransferase